MQLCGDKKRGDVTFLPFLKWEKLVLNLNKLFAASHLVYDSANYLNNGKIDKLGKQKKKPAFHGKHEYYNKIMCEVCSTFSCFLVAEEDITNFLQFTREKFPDMTITPKLYVLEEHVFPFLQKWYMDLGLYGEQGIEGIHSAFNTQSQHFDQVKKK